MIASLATGEPSRARVRARAKRTDELARVVFNISTAPVNTRAYRRRKNRCAAPAPSPFSRGGEKIDGCQSRWQRSRYQLAPTFISKYESFR
jgi:hypothetical protein